MMVVRVYFTRPNRPKYFGDPNPDTPAAVVEQNQSKHRRRAAYGAARARTKNA